MNRIAPLELYQQASKALDVIHTREMALVEEEFERQTQRWNSKPRWVRWFFRLNAPNRDHILVNDLIEVQDIMELETDKATLSRLKASALINSEAAAIHISNFDLQLITNLNRT